MKKSIKTMIFAAAAILFCGSAADCMAQSDSLKVKVTNIKTFTGNIMIAAGDYNKPMEMVVAMTPADGESVECVLKGNIAPESNIYVFHDVNGNFDLDMKDGIPAEGCYSGVIETDETGTAVVRLAYRAKNESAGL